MATEELYGVDTWVFTQLQSSSALQALVAERIHNLENVGPLGTATPYVGFQFQGGSHLRVIGAKRIYTQTTYLVKAVLNNSSGNPHAAGQQIVSAFDAVLDGMIGSNVGADLYVTGCAKLTPIRYVEDAGGGVRYLHWGGLYRVGIHPR